MEKQAKIVEKNGKFYVYTSDGERVLGRHRTKEEALAQERAIWASKKASVVFEKWAKRAKKRNRKDMPQMDGKSVRGIKTDYVVASKLNPSQKDVDQKKIKRMAREFSDGEPIKPIVVGSDFRIIDGHHRWKAAQQAFGKDFHVPVKIKGDEAEEVIEKESSKKSIKEFFKSLTFKNVDEAKKKSHKHMKRFVDEDIELNEELANLDNKEMRRSLRNWAAVGATGAAGAAGATSMD